MPYLYLLQLSYENVAVLSSKKKVEFNVGKIFSKNNIKSVILSKKEIEVDFLIFLNIIKKIYQDSMLEVHCIKNQCFLSIDNCIWLIGGIEEESLIVYKKVFVEKN